MVVVGGKFNLGRKIGLGSFGAVYRGSNDQGEDFAIKCEPLRTKHPQLLYESKLYKILAGQDGIPSVHWYGVQGDFSVMVMDLLGPSLEELFHACNKKFSLNTVLMLANRMISLVQTFHENNFLHRDIKPENMVMGRGAEANQVHIIDFGLAKKYRDARTHEHIPYREGKSFIGTARYASLRVHDGIEQSRRDDLEAVGYLLVYFLKGKLPWQGLQGKTKQEKYQKIGEKKGSVSVERLCQQMPPEFLAYLRYCRSLSFEETPDYDFLRNLFGDLFVREQFLDDLPFDWSGFRDTRSVAPACERDNGEPMPNLLIDVTQLASGQACGSMLPRQEVARPHCNEVR